MGCHCSSQARHLSPASDNNNNNNINHNNNNNNNNISSIGNDDFDVSDATATTTRRHRHPSHDSTSLLFHDTNTEMGSSNNNNNVSTTATDGHVLMHGVQSGSSDSIDTLCRIVGIQDVRSHLVNNGSATTSRAAVLGTSPAASLSDSGSPPTERETAHMLVAPAPNRRRQIDRTPPRSATASPRPINSLSVSITTEYSLDNNGGATVVLGKGTRGLGAHQQMSPSNTVLSSADGQHPRSADSDHDGSTAPGTGRTTCLDELLPNNPLLAPQFASTFDSTRSISPYNKSQASGASGQRMNSRAAYGSCASFEDVEAAAHPHPQQQQQSSSDKSVERQDSLTSTTDFMAVPTSGRRTRRGSVASSTATGFVEMDAPTVRQPKIKKTETILRGYDVDGSKMLNEYVVVQSIGEGAFA
eukprot:PhM_4_TR2114/c2_g2_i1/m.57610